MLTRFTPAFCSSAKETGPSAGPTTTLTGLGATAFTIATTALRLEG